MENVIDFNAAKAREATDKSRGANLTFVKSLGECLASIQVAADAGKSYTRVRIDPEVFSAVTDELARRGFELSRPSSPDHRGEGTVFDRLLRW